MDRAPTEIYPLSLHNALPIFAGVLARRAACVPPPQPPLLALRPPTPPVGDNQLFHRPARQHVPDHPTPRAVALGVPQHAAAPSWSRLEPYASAVSSSSGTSNS